MIYENRRAAGRILAQSVCGQRELRRAVVLGLPRGGVPVAFEVAQACKLPLDVLVVRKLGAPGQRELGMGAVTSGGTVVLNEGILEELCIRDEIVQAIIRREKAHAQQQERQYREGLTPLAIEGRDVILVDDGLATGATMRAALRAVRPQARRVTIAIPVGAAAACNELADEADLVICPLCPVAFGAVGQFYRDFEPTQDDEVCALLAQARRGDSA
jgi:putative phosphoribosyl transferase